LVELLQQRAGDVAHFIIHQQTPHVAGNVLACRHARRLRNFPLQIMRTTVTVTDRFQTVFQQIQHILTRKKYWRQQPVKDVMVR